MPPADFVAQIARGKENQPYSVQGHVRNHNHKEALVLQYRWLECGAYCLVS
jgi:hypothetical protein